MHDLPLLARQALDRMAAGETVTLNRPLFAATLVALTRLPREGVDALRADAEAIFALPPGPDWTNATLASFLQTYRWHVLFAHSPKALDLMGESTAHSFHTTNAVPVMWMASLDSLTPGDAAWMERWESLVSRWKRPLFTALLVRHLHDPAWEPAWDQWLNTHRFTFPLPLALIDSPGLRTNTTHALIVLERVMAHATTNLGDATASQANVHSHLFGALLGMQTPASTQRLEPRADHQFGLCMHDTNAESAIVFDAFSDDGARALRQAFPSALHWWQASPQERNAYVHERVFQATTPAPKTVKAPSLNADTKTLLATQSIRYAGIPNLVSYRQRALEALASGTLSKDQADKVRATLQQIHTASLTATIDLPQTWLDNFAKVSYKERRVIDHVHPALLVLGAGGLTQFAETGLALQRDHLKETTKPNSLPEHAITHLAANPSMEGLAWAIDKGIRHHQWVELLNASNPPSGWHDELLSQARFRQGWRDQGAEPNGFTSLVDDGWMWEVRDPALRKAWLAVERTKSPDQWSLSIEHMHALDPTYHRFLFTSWIKDTNLAGVLRLAIAAQEQDHAWFEAFHALSQRNGPHASSFPLVKRWTNATAHKRLSAMRTFNDPDALLEMEPAAITALLTTTLGG